MDYTKELKERDVLGPKIGKKQPTKLWSPVRERTWSYQYMNASRDVRPRPVK